MPNSGAPDFQTLIDLELRFFPSAEMRTAFHQASVPPRVVIERWEYGPGLHECWVIAENATHQIVCCQTGFGPAFPWSMQVKGAVDLGMDGEWDAYLLEAFVCSPLWKGDRPEDFMLMGPGERTTPPRE